MHELENQKVTTNHLARDAYLYIRQSSLKQVFENTESTKRQYGLKQEAIRLGWATEQIHVIDEDLGLSGASSEKRKGFQMLVTQVSAGKAGIVLGLEVSRLARNSTDWHRLLEICALTETLIMDEDGVYDPKHFNDRLLLGLKGTMSEAELHILRARLQGGIRSKARRGELQSPLPIGFVYNQDKKVILDPDQQIRETIHLFFKIFRQTGSAMATVKYFRKKDIKFALRIRKGPNKGDIVWDHLTHSRSLQLLHNERYAGTFFYGRTQPGRLEKDKRILVPREEWISRITNAHEGYITTEDYETNRKVLRENANQFDTQRVRGPAREGPALIQGIVICGKCGKRITIRYHLRNGERVPDYFCQREGIQNGEPFCQAIPGGVVDDAIEHLVLEAMSPHNIDVAIAVQKEVETRFEDMDKIRRKELERAQYEAELAKRRYMLVDPENRIVASSLEAEWNEKLRNLSRAKESYEKQRLSDSIKLTEEIKRKIHQLVNDFPKIWKDPHITHRERKRLVRYIIEDVTLIKNQKITAHVRFKGGYSKTLILMPPKSVWELYQTKPKIIKYINTLLDHYNNSEIAAILNQEGYRSGKNQLFNRRIIYSIQRTYQLKSRYNRLRDDNWLTTNEMKEQLQIHEQTLYTWAKAGLISSVILNQRGQRLFKCKEYQLPEKMQGKKLLERAKNNNLSFNSTKEVQYDT